MSIKNLFGSKGLNYYISMISCWTILLLNISRKISGDNLIYAIGEIHTYDSNIFNDNVYMANGVISPRYIVDRLFSFIMDINGGDWASAAVIFVYFGVFITALALTNIVFNICRKHQIIYSILFALLVSMNNNDLGAFRLLSLESTSIGTAQAFAMLAISFVIGEHKRFSLGWVFAGISVLLHIHEGFYGGAVVLLFLIAYIISGRKVDIKERLCLTFYIICILIIVIPNMTTDSLNISNENFVSIYALFRHPHHMVPSYWGWKNILRSFMINEFLMVFHIIHRFTSKREELRRCVWEIVMMSGAWIASVAISYIFIERYPIAFISTMFFSKSFKYVVLISLIWSLQVFAEMIESEKDLVGYLLLYYAFMTYNIEDKVLMAYGLIICAAIFFENGSCLHGSRWKKGKKAVYGSFFLLLIGYEVLAASGLRAVVLVFCCFMVWVLYDLWKRTRKKAILISVFLSTGLLSAFSLYGKLWYIDREEAHWISGKDLLIETMDYSLYELAGEFKEHTKITEGFLAEPRNNAAAGWFQIESQRNCYVLEKVIPSSKCRVKDWYERYMLTENLFKKDAKEIAWFMDQIGIKYLFASNEDFQKLDENSEFTRFLESRDGSYCIYERQ